MAQPQSFENAPINWIPAFVLISTPLAALLIVPYYLWTHSVSWQVWAIFAFFMAWNGLSITVGYHRLWSHRTYQAHPIVKWFFLIGGTLAVQGSVFDWCAGHRLHHRHVDDIYQDPYSAKRGFWFSHIGWMLKNYPSGHYDYKNIPDLKADPVLVAQDKYYALWILLANIGLPALFGWMVGDIAGTLVLAGLLRLVLSHHFTFFINSLCHMFGTRPYTDTNTARDNPILAIFTWGEGYHNYHHFFQYDYRNGVKWWQYDPTKWLIWTSSKLGLAKNLRRIPSFNIQKAELAMTFKYAEQDLAIYGHDVNTDILQMKQRIAQEYEAFTLTLNDWAKLKEQELQAKKAAMAEKIHQMDHKLKVDFQLLEHRLAHHRECLETLVRNIKKAPVSE